MNVRVKLFAAAREATGSGEVEVDLPSVARVAHVRSALATQWPQLASLAERSLVAVNAEYARDQDKLAEGDEVALIPPVSGG